MATFPLLRTGAYAQYPASQITGFNNLVLLFVDGTEQKYRNAVASRKTWKLQLELLDEQELAAFQLFFEQQQGSAQLFQFVDPWDGSTHASCPFSGDSFEILLEQDMRGSFEVLIEEVFLS
jgi:hypothetical protein